MDELKIDLREYYQLELLTPDTSSIVVYRSDDNADDIYGEHGVTIAPEKVDSLVEAAKSVVTENQDIFGDLFVDDPAMMSEFLAQQLGYDNIYRALEASFSSHEEFINYYLQPVVEPESTSEPEPVPEPDPSTYVTLDQLGDLPVEEPELFPEPEQPEQPEFNLGAIIKQQEEVPDIPRAVSLHMIEEATEKFQQTMIDFDKKMSNITEVIDFINNYKSTIEAGYSEYLRVFDTSGKFVGFEKAGKSIELLNAIKEFDNSVNLGDLDPSQLLTAEEQNDTALYLSDISPEVCKAFIVDLAKNAETDRDFIFLSHLVKDLVLFTRRYYGEER